MYLYTGIRFTTLLCLSKYMYQIYNIALLWLLLNIHLYYLQRPFPHSMYKTFYFCRRKWNWYVHTPNAQVPVLHTSIYRGIEYTQLLKASGLCLISEKIYYQSRQHTMYLPHILIRLFFLYQFHVHKMSIKCRKSQNKLHYNNCLKNIIQIYFIIPQSGTKTDCTPKHKPVIDYINIPANMTCNKTCYLVVVVH